MPYIGNTAQKLVTADDDININGKNLTAEKTNVMVS